MNLNHLKEFCYLAETLNFSHTAKYFYVSTSVISRHIASIENELGVKLFERTNNSVELTTAGQVFLEDARVLLYDYENSLERLAMLDSDTEAVVRIGYLHNASRPFIARFIHTMQTRYPEIVLHLSGIKFSELYSALDEHRVDLNFMLDVFPEASHDYQHVKIYEDQIYLVVNPENPLAKHREGITMDMIADQKVILPDAREYPGLSHRVDDLVAMVPGLNPLHRYVDTETLYLEVEVQDYVGFSTGAHRILLNDRVAFLPILDAYTRVDMCAFWRDSLSGHALDACLEVIEECREQIALQGSAIPGVPLER